MNTNKQEVKGEGNVPRRPTFNPRMKHTENREGARDAERVTLITKDCRNMTQAEKVQWRLYSQFDSVKLVNAPRFTEAGLYQWKVSY